MSDRHPELTGSLRAAGQIVDAAGLGVAGARVWIDPALAVTSDRDGRFALERLIGRSFEVRAQAGDRIGGPQMHRATEHSTDMVIELVEGAHVIVTVVDVMRAPVTDASIRVYGADVRVMTDASGIARFTAHPGSIAFEISAPGYAPVHDSIGATGPGVTERATIVLREGFEVCGRVLDEARRPIAHAQIFVDKLPSTRSTVEPAIAETDATGGFAIAAVVGMHTFFAVDDEHAPSRSVTLDVDRAITDLEIVMRTGAVYAGRVVDADGKGVANARVIVDTLSPPGQHRFVASSDSDGGFEIRGLPRKRRTDDDDDDDAMVHAYSEHGRSSDVAMKFRDSDLRGHELVLASFDETGIITGAVVDETGTPVAHALVNATARPKPPFTELMLRSKVSSCPDRSTATSTRANDRGEFVLTDLPAGEYGLWAGAFDQHHGLAIELAVGGDASPFITSANAGDTAVRVVLPRPGRITGKVAFVDSGELVDGFEVDLFAGSEITTGVPGWDGVFDIRDVKPRGYGLRIRRPPFTQSTMVSIRVKPGETVDLGTIAIERARTVRGTVFDVSGRPIAGANVMIGERGVFRQLGRYDLPTFAPSTAITDANGIFAIPEGAPAKALRLVIGADHPLHGRALPIRIPVGADDPAPVALTLLACGSVAGTLTRDGRPLTGASIDAGEPSYSSTTVTEDGAFVLSRVPAGVVALRVNVWADARDSMELFRAHERAVEVEAGRRRQITIEVPLGTIKLSIIVSASAAVAGAQLYLFTGTMTFTNYAELWAHFLIGLQGRVDWERDAPPAAFERLVPGDYTVCIMPLMGSPKDQEIMKRVYEDRAAVKIHCTPVRVVADREEQVVTVDI